MMFERGRCGPYLISSLLILVFRLRNLSLEFGQSGL